MTFVNRPAIAGRLQAAADRAREGFQRLSARLPWLNAERVAAIVIFVVATYFFVISLGYGVVEKGQAAPGTFPTVVAGGAMVLSAIWIFTGKPLKKDVEQETPDEEVLEHYTHESADHHAVADTTISDGDVSSRPLDSLDAAVAREIATRGGQPDQAANTLSNVEAANANALESDSHPGRLVFVIVWSAITLPFVDFIGMVPVLFVYLSILLWRVGGIRLWKSVLGCGVVLLVAAWGAYQAGIYLPDPFRIAQTITNTISGIFNR